jgi:branched-chain amino acid transport system substrate-binding protein
LRSLAHTRPTAAGWRIVVVGVCALLAVLAVSGCGSSPGSTSSAAPTTSTPLRTVTLWVDLPLAGAAAADGRQMLDAVRLIVAQVGYRVGNIGVRVRASDDADPATGHSDPTRCRAGAARAAADPTAIAVIGTYESSCTALTLPVLAAARLALVSPVNGDPDLGLDAPAGAQVLVRLAPSDAVQGVAAAAEAKALGAHRLFVVAGRSARSRALQTALVASAPGDDLTIVGAAPTPRTADGTAAVLARLRATRADSVWFGSASGPGVVAILRALAPPTVRRHAPRPLILIGSDALYRDGLVAAAGPSAEGLRVTSGFVPPDALGGAGADFSDAFARQFGEPGLYTAYAADAARLVLAALRRSTGSRAGVLRALFRTRTYNGLIGTVAIRPDGSSSLARIAVFRVHAGGFQLERVLDIPRS